MIVQRPLNSALATVAEHLCRAHGFEPRALQDSSDVVMATIAAVTNRAVCLVPASIRTVRIPGIVYRPIRSVVEAHMELHCFYLKQAPTPLLGAFLASVRKYRHGGAAEAEV